MGLLQCFGTPINLEIPRDDLIRNRSRHNRTFWSFGSFRLTSISSLLATGRVPPCFLIMEVGETQDDDEADTGEEKTKEELIAELQDLRAEDYRILLHTE